MIYFDNAASTKIHPEVLKTYTKLLENYYANEGSSHRLGLELNNLSNNSKKDILRTLRLDEKKYQLIFTSGATEANNLFLKGAAFKYANRGRKIITSKGEHSSVLKALQRLNNEFDYEIIELDLNEQGVVNPLDLQSAIDDKTIIVSIMAVNNETGAISNLKALSDIVKKYPKCIFHSDVTQALAKTDIDLNLLDAFSFSAHKINGLKGSGALVLKKSLTLTPLFDGGNYEYGFRAGTPDSPKNIVLAETLKLAFNNFVNHLDDIKLMNSRLVEYVTTNPHLVLNSPALAIPHTLNFSLLHHKAAIIANGLSSLDINIGTSSACSSKIHQPSHVIKAMFNDEKRASEVIRVSFGYFNTIDEVETLIKQLDNLLENVKYD